MVTHIEERGFDVLPAASGVPELVDMDADMRQMLTAKLMDLVSSYQFVILDLGAGINRTVLSFAAAAQQRLVIVTPEPTSLTDSYALIKVLATQHKVEHFCTVVNMAEDAKESALTFKRLNQACENFLGITLTNLGSVRQDSALTDAVRRQKPLMRLNPKAKAAQDIAALAEKYVLYRRGQAQALLDRPALGAFPVL